MKVVVYSTAWCVHCRMLKQFLTENGVSFEAKDPEVEPAAEREFSQRGWRSVPVTVITEDDGANEQVIIGIDKIRLKGLLNLK